MEEEEVEKIAQKQKALVAVWMMELLKALVEVEAGAEIEVKHSLYVDLVSRIRAMFCCICMALPAACLSLLHMRKLPTGWH